MKIEISNGFLKLTRVVPSDRTTKQDVFVKGSAIESIEQYEGLTCLEMHSKEIFVIEDCVSIMDAVAESYKDAKRR